MEGDWGNDIGGFDTYDSPGDVGDTSSFDGLDDTSDFLEAPDDFGEQISEPFNVSDNEFTDDEAPMELIDEETEFETDSMDVRNRAIMEVMAEELSYDEIDQVRDIVRDQGVDMAAAMQQVVDLREAPEDDGEKKVLRR